MNTRPFGNTGLEISELVFGGGMVGGLLIEQDDATKREAVNRALTAGINWIDTAPLYGQGRSERALGWLLADLPEPPHVSTKVHIDTDDLGDIAGQIEGSLTKSLERLRRDSVTVLHLHNPIGTETRGRTLDVKTLLEAGGVFDVFDDLKAQGLTQHWGITALGHTPSILRAIDSGRVQSAQVYYNLLNPSAGQELPPSWPVYDFGGLLEHCARQRVGVMNIRVFSAGVIATDRRTGRERPLTAGDSVESEAEKAQRVFERIGERFGTRAQVAIRFALAEARISGVVFGLAELAHLDEALAGQARGPLDAEALEEIYAVYEAGI